MPPSSPPSPGATLNYATAPRPRKSWPRRACNWARYHMGDRVGNAIMWIVAPLVIFAMIRPFTTFRFLLYLFSRH